MGWTASLDMGSEKMVMALASGEGSVCHLKGIKIMASQGIEHGVIKDKEKVRMCIRSLMSDERPGNRGDECGLVGSCFADRRTKNSRTYTKESR